MIRIILALLFALPAYAQVGPIPYSALGKPGGPARLDASGQIGALIAIPTGGTSASTLSTFLGLSASPMAFGGTSDCATDATTAINAAAATGKTLDLRGVPGSGACWLISGPIVLPHSRQVVIGDLWTKIVTTSATADVFQIGTGAEVDQVSMQDISIWSTVTKTAGACIHAVSVVGRASFRNIYCGDLSDVAANGNRLYDGVKFDTAAAFGEVSFAGKVNVSHDAFPLANGSEFLIHGDTRVTGCANGVHAKGNVGGLKLADGADISTCTNGVLFDTTVSSTPNREFLADGTVSIDGNTNAGISLAANSLVVMKLTGTWVANSPTCINIPGGQPAGSRWTWAGVHLDSCTSIGAAVGDGMLAMSGGFVTKSGTVGNGAPYFGVYLTSNKGSAISGNVFQGNGPASGATGAHDICACTGSPDYFTISGNVTPGGIENDPGGLAGRRLLRGNVGAADSP